MASVKQLRDRCKARAFDKGWSNYSEAFREYYNGLDRASQTAIINGDLQKIDGRIQNQVMQRWQAREKVEKEKGKIVEMGQSGCI